MNTFYNLNTNFVRIYGDVVYIPFFLYPRSLAKKPPFPHLHISIVPHPTIGNDWKRILTTLTLKKFNNVEKATNVSEFLLPLLNSFKLPSNLNNEPQDQSLHLPPCFHSDLPWSRAFRCRRGIRSRLENRPVPRLSSRAIIACREVLSVAALIAIKGCDNVRSECRTLNDLRVCERNFMMVKKDEK